MKFKIDGRYKLFNPPISSRLPSFIEFSLGREVKIKRGSIGLSFQSLITKPYVFEFQNSYILDSVTRSIFYRYRMMKVNKDFGTQILMTDPAVFS